MATRTLKSTKSAAPTSDLVDRIANMLKVLVSAKGAKMDLTIASVVGDDTMTPERADTVLGAIGFVKGGMEKRVTPAMVTQVRNVLILGETKYLAIVKESETIAKRQNVTSSANVIKGRIAVEVIKGLSVTQAAKAIDLKTRTEAEAAIAAWKAALGKLVEAAKAFELDAKTAKDLDKLQLLDVATLELKPAEEEEKAAA